MEKFVRNLTIVSAVIIMLLTCAVILTSCSDADTVNWNLTRDAEQFKCERRITVYNARTDKIIMYAEGCMNIDNNGSHELVVTIKEGESKYKKNYIYLNEYTMYVVEDITGTRTDPYHYKLYFHTEWTPDIEVAP